MKKERKPSRTILANESTQERSMDGFLKEKLRERKKNGLLRSMTTNKGVDFLSNDYLGLAHSEELHQRIVDRINRESFLGNGGTGSRLLSGNHKAYGSLESHLKSVFKADACLVFNSGYTANQAVVSCVASKGDTILYDRLSHVCLKEGAWLSKAKSYSFEHNDLEDLERRLKHAEGRIFVVTESVFSMDGDVAPLEELIALCEHYKAHLIVDEAHSTGVFGENGAGYLVEKGLEERVFARIYTFGKAMGTHGACIAGSEVLIEYLINFGRSFIYTTSLPPHSVFSIDESFHFLAERPAFQNELKKKIALFKSIIETDSSTAIQPILVPGNNKVREVARALQASGFNVRPIVSPTVKEGTERLRICLHSFNSDDDITELGHQLTKLIT